MPKTTTTKPLYVVQYRPDYAPLDVYYLEPGRAGEDNWTARRSQARTWTSKKLAENYVKRWLKYTSGWNAQTDTHGPSTVRPGYSVIELPE